MQSFVLRTADATELSAIQTLLRICHLPTDGVTPAMFFVVIIQEEQLLACAGFESYAPDILLRSVAVHPDYQRFGLGRRIVTEVLENARSEGYEEAYLLTTTAETFFSSLGFTHVDRSDVPKKVQQSIEFRSLCPSQATVMRKKTIAIGSNPSLHCCPFPPLVCHTSSNRTFLSTQNTH